MREGGFFPDHGLERIVAYHERQDARFAEAAHEISLATGKPILTATELAVADPANAGVAAVRATGRLCYPSGNRAVTALGHLYRYARFRGAPGPGLSRRSVVGLAAVGLVPAVGLGGLFLDADARADRNESITAVGAGERGPDSAAPRAVGPSGTDRPRRGRHPAALSVACSATWRRAIERRRCELLHGVARRRHGARGRRRPAGRPGEQHQADHRGGRARGARARLTFTTTVDRNAQRRRPSRAICSSSAAATRRCPRDDYPAPSRTRTRSSRSRASTTLADRDRGDGVARVTGRLVGDESRYDTVRYIDRLAGRHRLERRGRPARRAARRRRQGRRRRRLPASDPAATGGRASPGPARGPRRQRRRRRRPGAAAPVPRSSPSIDSAPITDVVREMLTTSDDNTAELMLKELGRRRGCRRVDRRPGSTSCARPSPVGASRSTASSCTTGRASRTPNRVPLLHLSSVVLDHFGATRRRATTASRSPGRPAR